MEEVAGAATLRDPVAAVCREPVSLSLPPLSPLCEAHKGGCTQIQKLTHSTHTTPLQHPALTHLLPQKANDGLTHQNSRPPP
jgi:hypothetical protein